MHTSSRFVLLLVAAGASACGASHARSESQSTQGIAAPSGAVLFSDDFEEMSVGTRWADGSTHGQWTSVFNGYGHNGIQSESWTNQVLSVDPQAVTGDTDTSAGLVVSNPSLGDMDMTLRVQTVAQTRTSSPNPWEVAWVLWHYTDDAHFYALVLKPNGWELDKQDPSYPGGQRFLATGASPTFPIATWRTVRVVQIGGDISVYVDGAFLTSFTDDAPYASGQIGAYAEDAHAWYDDVMVVAPSTSTDADAGAGGADAALDAGSSGDADAALDAGSADASASDAGAAGDAASAPSGYVYGVTVDDISNLGGVVNSLSSLPKRPTARIVFDQGQSPSYYAQAVPAVHAVSDVMGEILDSAYVKNVSVSQYTQRTSAYLAAFPADVDVWEVGNEINGNWLGAASDVAAKMTGAYDLVKAAGKRAELTLYGCSDSGAQYDMFNWVNANVPPRMLTGLDQVLVSYYEGDCGNPRTDWQSTFDALHALFPNSKIGFGEVGAVDSNGNDITNPSVAGPYLQKYYGMSITTPSYVGGYFWWYFAEDMVPTTQPMFPILTAAIAAMP